MTYSLEQSHDTWMNAYYLGKIDILKKYEHPHLKVLFRDSGIIETQLDRYERIRHAIQNGVWKPKKYDIDIEEFEYNEQNTRCKISMKSANGRLILEELWTFEASWKILALNV
ncbi:hypothetical protein [Acinetobacter shaoyimingii]|uniref:NTF2 fold immunity protein domain-containing protein n=1 Tax=Acinetobacter shaoyimingii TaxID=2715164 RepID=A0A6G8RZK3_9GAMM|nr:hypothetical protein [Acinetobacter shaoyimingii]QIO07382.1 hypothetical protein G8E00_16265 [Acinetobacter shaoyimingii]